MLLVHDHVEIVFQVICVENVMEQMIQREHLYASAL